MSKREIQINQMRCYNSGNEALILAGYEYKGTTAIKKGRKLVSVGVYEIEGKRVTIDTCKIERSKIKKLIVADFEGKTDQEIETETENTNPEPGI